MYCIWVLGQDMGLDWVRELARGVFVCGGCAVWLICVIQCIKSFLDKSPPPSLLRVKSHEKRYRKQDGSLASSEKHADHCAGRP